MSTHPTKVRIPTWDLSDRLAKSLRVADLSISEMAEYLGVSRNTIGNYVHGRTKPDKRTLILWAMRCGVPLPWLELGVEIDEEGGTIDRPTTDGYSDPGPGTHGYSVGLSA